MCQLLLASCTTDVRICVSHELCYSVLLHLRLSYVRLREVTDVKYVLCPFLCYVTEPVSAFFFSYCCLYAASVLYLPCSRVSHHFFPN